MTPSHPLADGTRGDAAGAGRRRRTYRSGEAELPVLRGVDLTLQAGEIVALVAPSGAGKSTLLHLAGLLERPDGGEVFVQRPRRRRAGGRRAHADPPRPDRLRLPVPSSARRVLRAGERRAAADDRRQAARRRRASARPRCSPAFGLGAAAAPSARQTVGRRAAACGDRARARQRARACCWPTSRRATSTSARRRRCSTSCSRPCATHGVAALIATHNPDLAARMDRTVTLHEGRVVAVS